MRMIAALAAAAGIAAALAPPAAAQTAGAFMSNPAFRDPPPRTCVSTFDMENCAAHALRVADADMSKAYAAGLKAAASRQGAASLRAAQRAWLTFRDQECPWEASRYAGGTMAGVVVASCWAQLTQERAAQLKRAMRP